MTRGSKKIKGGPRLTTLRYREEPVVDKLIEAHPILYRAGVHYHLNYIENSRFSA
jgi:hypothetical protein